MKKYLIHLILSKALTRRKLKMLVLVGALGFVFTLGLLTVGGVMVARELLPKAQAALSEVKPGEKLEQLTKKPITTDACLNAISSTLSPKTWLTEPLASTWNVIRTQCFDPQSKERSTT